MTFPKAMDNLSLRFNTETSRLVETAIITREEYETIREYVFDTIYHSVRENHKDSLDKLGE